MATSTPVFYTLSLHDALPISMAAEARGGQPALVEIAFHVAIGMNAGGLCEDVFAGNGLVRRHPAARSEEHTSELQSLRHLVCRLLLEKKKDVPVCDVTYRCPR